MEKKPHWSFWDYVNHDQVTKSVKSQKTNCKKITKKGKKNTFNIAHWMDTFRAIGSCWQERLLISLMETLDAGNFGKEERNSESKF